MRQEAPLHWYAHEYLHTHKSADWFWSVALIAIALAVIAIIMENLLFAVVIIVGTTALILLAIRKPDVIEIEILDRGIQAGNSFYAYSTLTSFWVEDRFFDDKLILKSSKPLIPYIVLPVQSVKPEIVRATLLRYLPEEEHEEPLSQRIMEKLGF